MNFTLLALFLQIITCFAVFFDVPIVRQVVGFFFFTFVTGFIILKLLKLDELNWVETVLFSLGHSIAFLMIAGLLINQLGFLFAISQPLSLTPLLVVLNSIILLFAFLVQLKDKGVKFWSTRSFRLSSCILFFLTLPILSIVGAIFVNIYANNKILLAVLMLIVLSFIIGVLFKKLERKELYPFAVLMIALAVLFHSSFISNYIIPFGSDIPGEFFVCKTTQNKAYWDSTAPIIGDIVYGRLNAMLSITILPTVYSTLLKIDSTWMFKLIFPLFFAFVPVGLFQIWQTQVGKKYAFIATFLFIAQFTFYTEMLGLSRQMIAELFFVLLLLTIFNNKLKRINRVICFIIFSFALVTSHYAIAEIFLFFISFALIALFILKRPSKKITFSMAIFIFTIMFTWYVFISGSTTFNSLLVYGDYVYQQLDEFFNPASRGQVVMMGLGMAESPSLLNTISRTFAYITQVFIIIGFVALITKRARSYMENEYFVFNLIAIIFLFMLILIPGLANTMSMTRFYHVLLFFLSPLCVVGADFLMDFISKKRKPILTSALLLAVLIPHFLFQSGFIYEVAGADSWSIPLSGYRMSSPRLYGHYGFTDAYSVFGARWLLENFNAKNLTLYADERTLTNVLTMHALIPRCNLLSNTTSVADDGVVYLSKLNVVYDLIPFERFLWNSSQLSYIFDELNIIYNNGGSEVYKNTP